jgi:hypothetical protein
MSNLTIYKATRDHKKFARLAVEGVQEIIGNTSCLFLFPELFLVLNVRFAQGIQRLRSKPGMYLVSARGRLSMRSVKNQLWLQLI